MTQFIIAELTGRIDTIMSGVTRDHAERSASGYATGRMLFEVSREEAKGIKPGMDASILTSEPTVFPAYETDPAAPENQPSVRAAWMAWQGAASKERDFDFVQCQRLRRDYYEELDAAREAVA